jgi:hypothetical protein
LKQIRAIYSGPLALVGYYDPTNDTINSKLISALNSWIQNAAAKVQAVYVDTQPAMEAAAGGGDLCAGGLLYKKDDGTCDIHPNPTGSSIIAGAIDAALPSAAN